MQDGGDSGSDLLPGLEELTAVMAVGRPLVLPGAFLEDQGKQILLRSCTFFKNTAMP